MTRYNEKDLKITAKRAVEKRRPQRRRSVDLLLDHYERTDPKAILEERRARQGRGR